MIVGVGIFEQFDYISMKAYIQEKAEKVHKARSNLVKKCGVYWYQEMTDAEWAKQKGNIVALKEGINNEQELSDYVCKEQTEYDLYDKPQYKFYLIPDLSPGKSAVVLKIHHSFTDGLGIATFFQMFTDEYDPKNLPAMKPLGLCKQLFVFLISPLLMLGAVLPTMIQKVDYNAMSCGKQMSGVKTGGFSYEINIDEMKKYCKAKSCTVNDHASSVLSCAMYAYFKEEEEAMAEAGEKVIPCPRSLHVAVPFSFR